MRVFIASGYWPCSRAARAEQNALRIIRLMCVCVCVLALIYTDRVVVVVVRQCDYTATAQKLTNL